MSRSGKHYTQPRHWRTDDSADAGAVSSDVIDLHPAVVLVLAGTNDIAGNTGGETLEQIEGDMRPWQRLAKALGFIWVFAR